MKNKEKYLEGIIAGIKDFNDEYVWFKLERFYGDLHKEEKISISTIVDDAVITCIKAFSKDDVNEFEWTYKYKSNANNLLVIHLRNKEKKYEGSFEMDVQDMIDVYFDEWFDAWLEEEVQEDARNNL